MLMIFYIQVVLKITHIRRKDRKNIFKILVIGKKEIKEICYLFLEEKIDCFKQK
jgi:hypothetical protein